MTVKELIIPVDKEQYKGVEVAELCNKAIAYAKANFNKEAIKESDIDSPYNLIWAIINIAQEMTDDDFLKEKAFDYCYKEYRQEIESYLRAA